MKKALSTILAILVVFCASVVFTGCKTSPKCDPKGKYWYNDMDLPSVINPYGIVYDGSYTIKIYDDGVVYFNPGNQVLKGQLTSSSTDKNDYSIQFEDGTTARVSCSISKDNRNLWVVYQGKYYNSYSHNLRTQSEDILKDMLENWQRSNRLS